MRKAHPSLTTTLAPDDRPDWGKWHTTGLILGLSCLGVGGLFWDTIQSMVGMWASSRTFSHGFLILPVTGYLIWCYRSVWIHLKPVPAPWGVLGLLLLEGAWFVGSVRDVLWIQQAAVVAMLPGLVWAILGAEFVRTLAWPLGYLAFLLPVGTSIEPWLREFTAWFIQAGLQLTQIPYYYDGYSITLTTHVWEVAPDCGGLRYLLPGLALGAAFVMLTYRHPVRRLTFLMLCGVVLMIANGLRAYGVIIGDHFGVADGTDHRVFSYAIYGVTIPLLGWIGLKWRENAPAASLEDHPSGVLGDIDFQKLILTAVAALSILAAGRLSIWLWFLYL